MRAGRNPCPCAVRRCILDEASLWPAPADSPAAYGECLSVCGLSRALLAFGFFAAEVAGMPMGRISRHRRCAWWAILDEKRDLHADISLPETASRRNTRYMICAERGFRILALKLRAKGDSHPEKRLRRPEPPVQGPAQAQNLAPRSVEIGRYRVAEVGFRWGRGPMPPTPMTSTARRP